MHLGVFFCTLKLHHFKVNGKHTWCGFSIQRLPRRRRWSCPLSAEYTTLYICSMLKRSFVRPDIFCPYQRFPQYPAPLGLIQFMFFHLFVCFCINLF